MPRRHLNTTTDAVRVFGLHLGAARREQRRTSTEIAERAGITRVTLSRIERGDPDAAIGLYFEVAMILNVPLFGADSRELADLAARGERDLALVPQRIRASQVTVDDNF